MPSILAVENTLVAGLLSRIRELPEYNSMNCIWVPDFLEPPATSTGVLVQVKNPTVTPSGMGGGSYLQKLEVMIGVFIRTAADPKFKWDKLLYTNNEAAARIRKQVINQSYSCLDIYLYEGGEQTTRPLVGTDGVPVKDCLWAAFSLWGLAAQDMLGFAY